ncbi:DNA protecting protein DprA [Bradyrhizobium sp. AZCC 1578]|uniref:DNA-processing protein DprA n=1 Tax=Bradyrhizobium sp. AZCC 1578 TaxID=3117027 RepID=UPI002FEFD07A
MPLQAADRTTGAAIGRRGGYVPPTEVHTHALPDLLVRIGRAALEDQQLDFLRDASPRREATVFYAGNLDILDAPTVSIVGTREVSEAGWRRASQLARDLVKAGVTVMSGLAKGVDTAALTSAISNGGRVAAVIGTPLDKAYPAENGQLQQQIYAHHLLMTPFKVGDRVFRSNFPTRNRVMAAISDATVIIEASDTSATLHQAAECVRLGRWLFIAKSVVDDGSLTWPERFVGQPKVGVLSSTFDLINAIGNP